MTVGNTVQDRLHAAGRIQQIVQSSDSPEAALERLFILALCRKPTASESKQLTALIGEDSKDIAAWQDVFWSLLNSTEFAFNH